MICIKILQFIKIIGGIFKILFFSVELFSKFIRIVNLHKIVCCIQTIIYLFFPRIISRVRKGFEFLKCLNPFIQTISKELS